MSVNSRNLLRLAILVGGFVPVLAGGAGLVLGAAMLGPQAVDIDTDSHFRYLSGLLLGIGLGFWSCIPEVERTTTRVRLLTVLVVLGGLGRLGGVLVHGIPGWPMVAALVMELVVTPPICFWQSTVATRGLDRYD